MNWGKKHTNTLPLGGVEGIEAFTSRGDLEVGLCG